MIAQQKDIGSGWGPIFATVPKELPCGSRTPAAAHATSHGARCHAISPQSFCLVELGPGWGGGLSLGPPPAPYVVSQAPSDNSDGAVTALLCLTTGADQTPGPFLTSRHHLFRGAARGWPSAGVLVGGQLARRHVTPGKPGCALQLRGAQGGRGLFAPQSTCPGSSRRQGSHLPCTSVGLLR